MQPGVLLLANAVLLLSPCLALGQQLVANTQLTGAPEYQQRPEGGHNSLVYSASGKVQLKLCECEVAKGNPAGLSCERTGWFITSFERQGTWVAGGGFVPLSHAICCRPCLPDELPEDSSGRVAPGQKPLAVMSLGCHTSTDELPVRCEGSGRSFAKGFSQAVRVFTAQDTWYPVNTINCCTPSLLLENGDAWELERCDCHDSHEAANVNCGGLATDELLFGYIFYRTSPLGHVVPVGPAQCCKVCLSPTLHPMDNCDDLSQCSHNGVCNLGQCECFSGWAGPDCSKWVGSGGHGGHGVPPWGVALIVLSSCALAGVFMVAAGHIVRLIQEGGEEGSEGGEERQPLLLRIDPDDAGSVGSQDTECDEEDVEEVQERVDRVIARLEHSAPGVSGGPSDSHEGAGAQPQPPATPSAQASPRAAATAAAAAAGGGAHAAAAMAAAAAAEAAAQHEDSAAAGAAGAASPRAGGVAAATAVEGGGAAGAEAAGGAIAVQQAPSSVAAAGAGAGAAAEGKEDDEEEEGGGMEARIRARRELDPLGYVDCIVCMSRPVQTVLVPCGHVCICRRCSRKLHRCPVCRKDIARRQRLYI